MTAPACGCFRPQKYGHTVACRDLAATGATLPEHGPWSRAETEGADLAAEIRFEDEFMRSLDAAYEADLEAAYGEDPDAFA